MRTMMGMVATRFDTIEKVMAFPLDEVLERYVQDENISMDAAKEHERELKRYLALVALNPEVRYGMKGPVDNLWHTFIIFTHFYERFCQKVAGHFIHHEPTPLHKRSDPEGKNNYFRFLSDYEEVFGESAPIHLWPRIRKGLTTDCNSCGSSCGCGSGSGCSGCSSGCGNG